MLGLVTFYVRTQTSLVFTVCGEFARNISLLGSGNWRTVARDAPAMADKTMKGKLMTSKQDWWRDAVIYQVYPRSFADSNGDGYGDLPGITSHLKDIADLGVDAIWLSPFYPSPGNDAGYDVADYKDVDPLFGNLADFDDLLATAHKLGLRVIVDIVPNHSSSEHVWFQEALVAGPGSEERARYIFRDGKGENGELPPNNWESTFGGRAWTRVVEADGKPGEWYLHLFDSTQPDFDWTNPWVADQFDSILRFWLDRGVDGFRIDVAHGMVKEEGLPDWVVPEGADSMGTGAGPCPYLNQPGVHDIYRRWNQVVSEYGGDRVLCAEAWVEPAASLSLYVRPGELHQAFNFPFLLADWSAGDVRGIIDESIRDIGAVGAPATWVLSNHDVIRHASRLALTVPSEQGHGIGPKSPGLPDPAVGARRARAATLMMLALPGSAYLYQGEELGLPEHIYMPDHARRDPTWARTNGERYGRDGSRVPIPWEADAPAAGFNTTGKTWLPQPDDWGTYARSSQEGLAGSSLEFYKEALRLRRELNLGSSAFAWIDGFPEDILAFRSGDTQSFTNYGTSAVELPLGEIIMSSSPVDTIDQAIVLPPDTTVWVRQS